MVTQDNQPAVSSSALVNGMLFVASTVDAEHDADFNAWYDREHVEERVRVEGFLSGARYLRVGDSDVWPRYLGLYRTRGLDVFTTDAYRAAFTRQTPWSIANLDRMKNPMRRVCAVEAGIGFGSGSRVSVLALDLADDRTDLVARAAATGQALAEIPGFVYSYLLVPDETLSAPLPKESTVGRVLRPMLVIETSHDDGRHATLAQAGERLGADPQRAGHYALGWKLYCGDLA